MEALEKGRYDMGMSSPPPLIFPPRSATLSFVSEPSSPGSGTGSHSVTRLRKNSAKMRKIQLSSRLASPIPSVTSAKSTVSKQPSSKPWEYVPILTDEQYAVKKERLLRGSKLKRELEKYWNIETPSRLEKKRLDEISSEDEEYDTDLDQELVGLELIVDEKTKQIKDDGLFPEYKRMCRKLNVIPNHYLLRHSTDDDIKLRHRYLSKNDCTAMGYEMKDNSTFSKIDLEDNGMTGKHIHALAEMLLQNHYVSDINLSNNPVGVPGAKVVRYILTNNTHIRKVDLTGCKIQDVGGKVMAEILEHNVYIKQLLLSRNGIGDESAIQFGKVLESNSTLEILDLSWNQINRPGAHALAVGLRNNHGLQSLILNMNGVGKEGGSSLIECLRLNSTLTILDIGANRIPDDIAPVIARVLPSNKALHTLKLSYNLITSEGAMTLLKPWSSKIKKKSPLKKIELDGTDVHTELALLVHKLREKRGLTVTVRLPPSRRERSLDPLMGSLMYIVRFCDKEDVDLPELFPRSYEEKGVLISTDDVVELIKHSGKDIGKYRLHELKRTLQETRDRRFELKELLTIHNQMRLGKDPQREDSLRSAIAGKRRGIPVETLQVSTPSTAGVRFRGGSDDED